MARINEDVKAAEDDVIRFNSLLLFYQTLQRQKIKCLDFQ
jgi:hypothetical protein